VAARTRRQGANNPHSPRQQRIPTGRVPPISTRSHCRPNSDTAVCEVKATWGSVPRPTFLSPAVAQTGGAFSWNSFPPPALRERCHCGLACRRIAVCGRATFVVPKGYRPHLPIPPRSIPLLDLPRAFCRSPCRLCLLKIEHRRSPLTEASVERIGRDIRRCLPGAADAMESGQAKTLRQVDETIAQAKNRIR
jgi:hypothetical protein